MFLEEIRNFFRKPPTKRYPFGDFKPHERFRGKISFDKSKCIGCAMCRMYCPSGAIKLTWKIKKIIVNNVQHQKIIHPIYQINIGKCIRCGMCVDVCPVKCIWFTKEFELSEKNKENFILETV
ncbi:MAG: 4Fe-4S dicluster domain-containing protein [Candidatus Aenigmatarchaeota archaeon]